MHAHHGQLGTHARARSWAFDRSNYSPTSKFACVAIQLTCYPQYLIRQLRSDGQLIGRCMFSISNIQCVSWLTEICCHNQMNYNSNDIEQASGMQLQTDPHSR